MELNREDYVRLLDRTHFFSIGFVTWILNKFNMGAITFVTIVFIDKKLRDNTDTILHELVHVQQYHNYWFVGFIPVYLYYFFRGWIITDFHSAYMCVPFEVEAYDYKDPKFSLYYYTGKIPSIGL